MLKWGGEIAPAQEDQAVHRGANEGGHGQSAELLASGLGSFLVTRRVSSRHALGDYRRFQGGRGDVVHATRRARFLALGECANVGGYAGEVGRANNVALCDRHV